MYHFTAHSTRGLKPIPIVLYMYALLPLTNDDDSKTMLQEKRLQVLRIEQKDTFNALCYVMLCLLSLFVWLPNCFRVSLGMTPLCVKFK